MADVSETKKDFSQLIAVSAGVGAYLIWGVSPLYWNELGQVPSFEIIIHRILWALLFLLILVMIRRQFGALLSIFKNPRLLCILLVTALLVSTNWLVYIWSVNHGYIIQASLGYYINPLVNVLLGMLFLKERLRRPQIIAVILAACGVLFLTFFYGSFPWVSLTLAFSFGFYGLIRKSAAIGALLGLTMETLLLSLPAFIYLVMLHRQGNGSFGNISLKTDLFLMGTAFYTAVPLLLFNVAGKRLMLATLGFLQYLAPSTMLLIGLYVWEKTLVPAQLISFLFIWTALFLYSLDSVKTYRSTHKKPPARTWSKAPRNRRNA